MPSDEPSWLRYKDRELGGKGQKSPKDPNMYAAMIHLADRQLGEIFALLKELGIDDETLVVFSGDNGGKAYFKDAEHPRGVFEPNSTVYRGGKGDLLEGGLRIPYVVRWPGHVAAETTTDHLCYFPDVMPTLADLCELEMPADRDGVSFAPTLLDEPTQSQHKFLYWEYGGQIAVRKGSWKAYRKSGQSPWCLYDLDSDSYEAFDLSSEQPDLLKEMIAFAEEAHDKPVTGGWIDRSQRYGRARP